MCNIFQNLIFDKLHFLGFLNPQSPPKYQIRKIYFRINFPLLTILKGIIQGFKCDRNLSKHRNIKNNDQNMPFISKKQYYKKLPFFTIFLNTYSVSIHHFASYCKILSYGYFFQLSRYKKITVCDESHIVLPTICRKLFENNKMLKIKQNEQ